VNGFNPSLIAGEEPDLCLRLRQQGWRIWSDGRDMTLHDVDMNSLGQWWRRALRAGYAMCELVAIHGDSAEASWRRLLRSAFFWSMLLLLSAFSLIGFLLTRDPVFLLCVFAPHLLISLQIVRTAFRFRTHLPFAKALRWSALIFISKLPQLQGAVLYLMRRAQSRQKAIIEYK
jgi:hypothetical protein